MADRNTTGTPYKLSADGICYFRYPDGDAPVVTVADYAELRTKGLADAGAGNRIHVTNTGISGVFEWSSNDPYGDGEDGGSVFTATDGWWARVYFYRRDNPVQLSWYEFNTDDDATEVFQKWLDRRPNGIAFKMPEFAGHIIVNTITARIKEFSVFGGATELWQHPAPDDDYNIFVLSGISYLVTDSSLVCRGRYGDFGTSPGNLYDPGAFFNINGATLDCSFYAQFFDTTGRGLDISGAGRDVTIGSYAVNSGIRVTAGANVNLHYDNAYLSDPDGNGLKSYTNNLAEKWHGFWIVGAQKVTGKIITQYGGAKWFMNGCKELGNSAEDPFTIETNDQGYDPEGVPNGDAEGTQWNCGKIDGLSSDVTSLGSRFLRHVTNGHNRNRHWFVQYEASNETGTGLYATSYIRAEYLGGQTSPVRIGEFNSNPNECKGHEIVGNSNWMSVSASESTWTGFDFGGSVEFVQAYQYVPLDNVMNGCTHAGGILLVDGTLTCNSPVFTGAARQIISIGNLGNNVVLRVNNLTAPIGSTIDKSQSGNPDPEFYLDDVLTSLPYTVV